LDLTKNQLQNKLSTNITNPIIKMLTQFKIHVMKSAAAVECFALLGVSMSVDGKRSQDVRQHNNQYYNHRQNDERQPGLQEPKETDVFAVHHHQEAQLDHIPRSRPLVFH